MSIVIHGVTLIDGTGSAPQAAAVIVIEGTQFAGVGGEGTVQLPEHPTQRWHLPGLTALPGLIDAHVHLLFNPDPSAVRASPMPRSELLVLRAAVRARRTLAAGFTTVRDLGAPNAPIFSLRQAVAEGTVPGPRIIASGRCLTITGGHGTQYGWPMAWEVDGPEEFRKAVRKQIKLGADCVKVMATRPAFSPPYRGRTSFLVEEMRPGVEDAHAAGAAVAAHAHTSIEGIRNAVLAGVDSIEHGDPADDSTLEMMAARGTMLVPTLALSEGLRQAAQRESFPFGEPLRQRVEQKLELALHTVRRAKGLGVLMALGTDAGFTAVWHGANALELALFVRAGLSPMEALLAGTKHAAKVCGRSATLGTVEVGKQADLIVVEGNPLEDIELLQDRERIKLIVQDGRVVVNRGLAAEP